jgi:hypothetical protein
MQNVTRELATIAKLKDALSDFQSCAVNLIEEEYHRSIASHREPVGRTKGSYAFVNSRQTQKVAFGHLRSATLHNRHLQGRGVLVNH